MNNTETVPILRLTEQGISNINDVVAREFAVTIVLNGRELVTLLCSPADLQYLAVGFLLSEGLLTAKDEIRRMTDDYRTGTVRIDTERDERPTGAAASARSITSGCGGGVSFHSAADVVQGQAKVESGAEISTHEVMALMKEFQHRSSTFIATGGVHSAALCDRNRILIFSEDIGRHNAIDKVFGECILNGVPTGDRMLFTSGRVSSEIVLKTARRHVPIIVSKSAPTDLGLRLADDLGVTLLGFVRGGRMNVYTHDRRIARDGKQDC